MLTKSQCESLDIVYKPELKKATHGTVTFKGMQFHFQQLKRNEWEGWFHGHDDEVTVSSSLVKLFQEA